MLPTVSLDGLTLPAQFSYRPYIPSKRNSVTPTAGAVIVQYAPNQIIHGEGAVPWNLEAATPVEFKSLWDKYNTATPSLYTFIGYWGETLQVYFTTFDPPDVKGRLFNLAGQFQVIDVTVDYNPKCGWWV